MTLPHASYDLHLHTYWSYDALAAPEEFFIQAQRLGLRAIAVTDNHNFDAFGEIRALAPKYPGVHFAAGAEMSARTPHGVLDIVCLGLPETPTGTWKDILDRSHALQCEWGDAISRECLRIGIPFTREAREQVLRSYRPAHVIDVQGITHVRSTNELEFLFAHGLKSREQFMDDIVSHAMGDDAFLDSRDIIAAVHDAGGICLWAHPSDYHPVADEKWLDVLREYAPADGIECVNSTPPELAAFYRQYCLKHKMLSSAGSDSHTCPLDNPDANGMAKFTADDRWLDELLERITLF